MRNNHIHIAVVNNRKIVEVAEVNADTKALSTTLQPVIVKAIAGGKYLLTEDVNGTAPENITVKRVGHNLWISFEGEDLDHPGLNIEDFYDYDGEVIGKGVDVSNAGSNTGATDDTIVAPVADVPPITQISGAGAVHGSVASGGVTNDNTPTLTG